ncbi:sugar kinase [Actinomadura sp. NBRC 104425]|uniref:sugar kinase n=1 Tax=Actinomadura sp. NBRC 104425 TaxID=3032204 RepID=UPI0024A1F70C|nr:sugar kinase [Actinomadura sp. NBRC 104425]GLZ12215.1 sugar kinase [Actinomadura sp. NBRC 104425]
MTRVDVLTVGETMMALRATGLIALGSGFTASIAGAESNVAIGLSRLGHRAAWLGRVGADEPGRLVVRTLAAEGVDVSAVRRDDAAPTGLIMFEQRLPDVTRVHYVRAGSAGSRLSPQDVAAAPYEPAIVHLTGITPALGPSCRDAVRAAFALAREHGARISLDVNHRTRLWTRAEAARTLAPLAEQADHVIASPDELMLLGPGDSPEAVAARLLDGGATEVVVKDGAAGACSYTAAGTRAVPAHAVQAVDSIGAGDGFAAGYLSGLLDGLDVEGRLRRAHTVGAFAVSTRGDWEGLPYRDELDLIGLPEGAALR